LELDRMLVAMEQLVGEEIAAVGARVAPCEPLDEAEIGRHRTERSKVVLACRAEQLRAGAVVRSAEDDDQLRALVPAQLAVSPGVRRGAPARINMRRYEAGQASRRRRRRERGTSGRVGALEERLDLGAQPRRLGLIAQ